MFGALSQRLPIAHRGFSMHYPENTALAFEQALAHPIWGMELDLQLTADGHVVVFHDDDLRRIGASMRHVSGMTLAEYQALDLAAWFGGDHPAQCVLTLERLLETFGQRTRLLLEIKVNPHARDPLHHRKLMAHVVRAIVAADLCASTAILCFDFELLVYGHLIDSRVQFVWNQRRARRADGDDFLAAYSVDFVGLSAAFVEVAHAHGKPVLTYTVNDEEALHHVLQAGANGIMSDNPEWLCGQLAGLGNQG